ncbi:GGDEF domain-containing protein (plasmid) [Skermanella sp. TT6]|uniref:diguanylate cyclase n=1 Tax=Skermanella cutis TaxID=2775420 RepID=A0ABX7BII5_9PROT|nr:GGDEF domain-containing protein [Skermanella sp. TT6]QQP93988.1 GGDEF domain-containing protein [Skermanella sp. TT6]
MEQADLWGGQAMVRIAAEGLQPTPPYFTVWYTYYSSQLPDLSRVVDRLAATGQPFTPAELDALWQRFFSYDREQKVVRDTGERIQGALAQLIDLLRSAGVDAGRYVGTLRQFSARLDIPELEPLRSLLDVIVTETELVARLNQELEGRIQATAAEMEELRRSLDGERREADTDALTGLFNRRRFDAVLYETVSQAALSGQPVSLLMLDIDHFKKVNDSHSHAVGDQVLALVARSRWRRRSAGRLPPGRSSTGHRTGRSARSRCRSGRHSSCRTRHRRLSSSAPTAGSTRPSMPDATAWWPSRMQASASRTADTVRSSSTGIRDV